MEVLNILSHKGVVTISLLLRGVNFRLACNANEVLMNDLLASESNKTRAGSSKIEIIPIIEFGFACTSFAIIVKIWVSVR